MKKTDYLGLTLAEELDNPGDLKFVNDNPTLLDTKIKSMDTDIATLKPLLTAPTIKVPTLYNNWVASSPTTYPLKYWKEADGMVHFRLAVKNGSMGSNNAITIFPTGHRVATAEMHHGYVDTGGDIEVALFEVLPNGNLQNIRTLPANSLVVINGCFRAAT